MNNAKRTRVLVPLIAIIVLAIGAILFFASKSDPNGLKPGDVYSQGLDVERTEEDKYLRFLTVYGKDVIASPSLFRPAKLGSRQPRVYIAVVAPERTFVNGTGFESKHGEDLSILRESLSWGVMQNPADVNNTETKTLNYEYDGRKKELCIGKEVFPLSDGYQFVILLDKDWNPSIHRVNDNLNVLPVSQELQSQLRGFFGIE